MAQVESMKRIKAINVSELSKGIGKVVIFNGEEIALFKQEDGSVNAIQNRCPHKNGPLAEGIVSGEYVFCPLHDWKINTEDGKVQAPDVGCVKRYDVEISDGVVYLFVS
ncbi:nitrite reductase small subunit NirD [Halalkalibacter urbisdiaboli]|uniref:nitrite reductase small subunit NirD n=1 Tax=Halalkalibacter urbisdiaboli TaxID=1960589 RepID=UPI000B44734B|nr:nitrite reductase small subunit NirD [Halalkalibacter urbisdiaboli]